MRMAAKICPFCGDEKQKRHYEWFSEALGKNSSRVRYYCVRCTSEGRTAGRPPVKFCSKHNLDKIRVVRKNGWLVYHCPECRKEYVAKHIAKQCKEPKPRKKREPANEIFCEKHGLKKIERPRRDGGRYFYCVECRKDQKARYLLSRGIVQKHKLPEEKEEEEELTLIWMPSTAVKEPAEQWLRIATPEQKIVTRRWCCIAQSTQDSG